MNSHKIVSLATPTLTADLCTKAYIDDGIASNDGTTRQILCALNSDSKLVANQTELTNNATPLNMNSKKITSLADATTDTDALNRQTADSRYYLATTALNSIANPTSAVSMNSYKITELADASTDTDVINR